MSVLMEIKQFLNIVGGYEEATIPYSNDYHQAYHLEEELGLSDWKLRPVPFLSPIYTLCPRYSRIYQV